MLCLLGCMYRPQTHPSTRTHHPRLLLHTDNASGQDPAFLPCPGVTRITLTPSLLSTLLQSPAPLFTPGSSLRLCLCSGEALSRDLAAGFFAALPLSSSTTLLHLYGSTEVSGDATFLALTREEMQTKAKEVGLVPLGRPLPGTRLWVVEDGNAVEVEGERQEAILDMEGELWVEGPGVALGYYRASESSDGDNVFFHREEGSPHLTFKTGDWVRYTHGAEAGQPHVLTFRIRRDSMVKVRGIRVGLEEGEGRIAAALQVENPRGALGLTLAPRPSDSSSSSSSHSVEDNVLVLAVTAQVARRWPDQARLRAQLQAAGLPEEMMPFRIVVGAQGQALPLTTSGKLDRQQLATWGTTAAHSSTHTHTPPMRRQEEESEVDAWLEARFAALVGSHDLGAVGLGLFERGGHSLLAMQALSELRARFGAVAERLTVEDLGRKVSEIARLLLPEGQRKRPRAEEQDVVGAFAVTMSERWRFALDKCVDAQPCLVPMGEAAASWWVILGAHDHTVVALDLQTGQQQWRARVQGRVEGAVSVHKDLAFVPCYDGRVYALRLRTGEEVWSCLTEGEIKCTPLPLSSPTEVVVIGSYDGHLYICETSGGTLWAPRTALGGSLFAAPLLLPPPSGGEKEARIITVTNKGRVAQWRLQEGGGENDLPGVLEQEWCYEVGCPVFTTPALSPSTSWLLLGGTDGSVFALDPTQGGAVVWRISLQGGGGGPVFASPCLLMSKDGEETVLVASQHKGSLHCLGAHSGKSKWWVEMAAAGSDNEVISGKPALLGDRFALVGTSHGRVQVVDVLDGRVVAAPLSLGQAQQRLSSPAAMQVGESTWRVVCGSRDDGVYMIEVQAGMK